MRSSRSGWGGGTLKKLVSCNVSLEHVPEKKDKKREILCLGFDF